MSTPVHLGAAVLRGGGQRWVEYLKGDQAPRPEIALLYQDDDFGKATSRDHKAIEGTDMTLVAEESFNRWPAAPRSGRDQLSQSGADVFVVASEATPCPRTAVVHAGHLTPDTIVSVTCASKTALPGRRQGPGRDRGPAHAGPGRPADASQSQGGGVRRAGGGRRPDAGPGHRWHRRSGWGFAALSPRPWKETPEVDRAAVMNTLIQPGGRNFGLARDEVTGHTDGADDPWVIEGFRIAKRHRRGLDRADPRHGTTRGKSNSYAGKLTPRYCCGQQPAGRGRPASGPAVPRPARDSTRGPPVHHRGADRPRGHRDHEPPDRRNALGLAAPAGAAGSLRHARHLRRDGIVLAGAGPVFSAGHDLAEMSGQDEGAIRLLLDTCTDVMAAIRSPPRCAGPGPRPGHGGRLPAGGHL